MPSFAVSIAILSLVQAALVALPKARALPLPAGLRSRWWALVPAGSIVVVIAVVNFYSDSATALAWLALVAVPPFAALALALLVRGSRPAWAPAVVPLFALAWASTGSLAGQSAALALSALGCIGLGWLLVSVVPAYWLKLGVYAMAAIDTWFVASDLLQGPNATLTAASPGTLPRLHVAHFGSAQMGFGDLFIAATVGCLLAGSRRRQLQGAILAAALGLAFDLLFLTVNELPATVPVALALAAVELKERWASQPK
ncbi:MAG TPA: hypothetical protein VII45_04255 [Solirubrobacterales bacterium]